MRTDPDLQKNRFKFGYSIYYKYEGQLSHPIDTFHVVLKFKLPKLNAIPMMFRKMTVNYKDFKYLSPYDSIEYGQM